MNGDDLRVVQRRGGFGPLDESSFALGVSDLLGGQDLDCDKAIEARVPHLVDHPHPAFAQLLEDLVVADGLANHGRSPDRKIGPGCCLVDQLYSNDGQIEL